MDPQNLKPNPVTRPQGIMSILMARLSTPVQMPTTIDLIIGESHEIEASGHHE
jgi:hypothetical protein